MADQLHVSSRLRRCRFHGRAQSRIPRPRCKANARRWSEPCDYWSDPTRASLESAMGIRHLSSESWQEELDSFSRRHEGWIVSINTRKAHGGVAVEARDVPLE